MFLGLDDNALAEVAFELNNNGSLQSGGAQKEGRRHQGESKKLIFQMCGTTFFRFSGEGELTETHLTRKCWQYDVESVMAQRGFSIVGDSFDKGVLLKEWRKAGDTREKAKI